MSDPMLPSGTNRCRCMACGAYFSTIGNFDRHQRTGNDGRPVCRKPASVGLIQGESGHWQMPGNPDMPHFTQTETPERTEDVKQASGAMQGMLPL